MADITATILGVIQLAQLALKVLYTLSLTDWRFPPTCTVTNGSYYDFIIIGGGGAGSVLGNRLTANSSYSALIIEAGGNPPLESEMPGVFTLLPSSQYEYNITTYNDGRTCQNLQDNAYKITAGKMLGGSTSLGHVSQARGDPRDYNNWAEQSGDDSWNYKNMYKYFIKQETLIDAELLNSPYASLHGTNGPIKIARETYTENIPLLNAAANLGHNVVLDVTSNTSSLGISEPLFQIDGVRQSTAITYLGEARSRTNLCVSPSSTATKILMENGTAVGVRFVDSNGDIIVVYANKEVILSAGALNSPKVLMLSGIGPSSQLESFGIDVVANLPVGEYFQDAPTVALFYQLADDTSTTPASNPFKFPAPATFLYATTNSSQTCPEYQSINLLIPHDSTAAVQVTSNVFKYKNDICNKWYEASVNKSMLFTALSLLHPKSYGNLRLASADYNDNPIVTTGFLNDTNGEDLKLMADSLADFNKIPVSMNGTLVDLGLCNNTTTDAEYWECYAMTMSNGIWRPIGTCKMGTVVDTKLNVIGIKNLRVVDASVMLSQISGNSGAAVVAIAEYASDLILNKWNITV